MGEGEGRRGGQVRQPGLGGRGREGSVGEIKRGKRVSGAGGGGGGLQGRGQRGDAEGKKKKKEGKKLSISYTLAPSPNKHPPSTTANTTTQTHAALL